MTNVARRTCAPLDRPAARCG